MYKRQTVSSFNDKSNKKYFCKTKDNRVIDKKLETSFLSNWATIFKISLEQHFL